MRIAVGGMIASGKSTLVKQLGEILDIPHMDEFEQNDPVFNTLLEWLYQGVEDVEMLLQIYFLHKHWKTQKKYDEEIIIDRHMIEHWLFAQKNIKDKTIKNFYNGVFNAYMNDIKSIDLYLILSVDWNTFVERIHKRGRQQEIDNFDANESYFRQLHSDYIRLLKAQCAIHDIPVEVIHAGGEEEDVLQIALRAIENRKRLNALNEEPGDV